MPLRYCIITFLAALTVFGQFQVGAPAVIGGVGGRGGQANGAQAPPPATDCAASGTVVNSVTGEPIPRAMVTMGGSDSSGSATDASGHWSITNTACGSRLPMATHTGFISQNQIQSAVGRQPIQLVSGSPVTGIKVPLIPEASIVGSARDADGDPLDSVQIRVMRVGISQGARILGNAGGTSVDSQGNFRIGRLSPGRYIVCASSPMTTYPVGGGEPLVYRESCFPGPASSGISNAMPVEAGREVRTSFTLTAARGVHVRGSVSGGLQTSDQGPFTQVQLMPSQNIGSGHGGRLRPDGTFDIASVPPGSYIARVNFRTAQPGPGPVPVLFGETTVEVGATDVGNVTIVVRPPGSLAGAVRFELTGAGVPASTGAPQSKPTVNVNLNPPVNGVAFGGQISAAKWDASHTNFEFNPVSSGQFRLNTNVGGAAGAYIKAVTLRGQDIGNQQVFAIDGTTGPVEIVISDDVGSLDATVSGADGNPLPGSVMLLGTTGRRVTLSASDDGHAIRKNLPVGEYKAWAFDNINLVPYADEQWMTQNAGIGERVTIASGGSATVTLKRIAAPPE